MSKVARFGGWFVDDFLIDFSFHFILLYWVYWELDFVIFFDLLFMGLSQTYDPGCKFYMLS
jgi:hypothetical protein